MDLVSDLEWLYRQDLLKIQHGQLSFLGLRVMSFHPGFSTFSPFSIALMRFTATRVLDPHDLVSSI